MALSGINTLPFDITFGLWGALNPGSDPFGGSPREWCLIVRHGDVEQELAERRVLIEKVLRGLADVNKKLIAEATRQNMDNPEKWKIKGISVHDEDLWPYDATAEQKVRMARWLKNLLDELGLEVQCYTTNCFSNAAFRSGAFSSPLGEIRDATIVKACLGIEPMLILNPKQVIFWGGREGTEIYEQDVVLATHWYMRNAKIVVTYLIRHGYAGIFSFEPKLWEPRFNLYAGSGEAFSALIPKYFFESIYQGRVGINLELPQHVAMSCVSPVLAAGNALHTGDMLGVCHCGGQIAGRMDADFAPGLGGNLLEDFQTMLTLMTHRERWGGVLELDCRPLRTTTTFEGLLTFLKWCVWYLRSIENKVDEYVRDPIIEKIVDERLANVSRADELARDWDPEDVAEELLKDIRPLDALAKIPTDCIEAQAYRTIQIILGWSGLGAWLFNDTPWTVSDPRA